jgi:hypothetical protein
MGTILLACLILAYVLPIPLLLLRLTWILFGKR